MRSNKMRPDDRERSDEEESGNEDDDEEEPPAPPVSQKRTPTRSSFYLNRRKKGEWVSPTAQMCMAINDRLKGLAQKVCTALQRQIPVGSTRSIFEITFVLHTGIEELETQHLPMSVTVSLEQGANDITRGPVPLITGSKPVLSGILKNPGMNETKARALIFKVIAEWLYRCWEKIAANEKLGVFPGRSFSASIQTTPPVPGGLTFDLRLGEWVGEGVSYFAEEEEVKASSPDDTKSPSTVETAYTAGVPAEANKPSLPKPLVCDKGHLLLPLGRDEMLHDESYDSGYTCDQCQIAYQTIADNEVVRHCNQCSYDLCPKCAATRTPPKPQAEVSNTTTVTGTDPTNAT
ncbi:hypothetical protein Pelo_11875 [Pelomyxa schiedti]|nr:hypothetical protein Pelo_11875 [Pelomyxa schiedti]